MSANDDSDRIKTSSLFVARNADFLSLKLTCTQACPEVTGISRQRTNWARGSFPSPKPKRNLFKPTPDACIRLQGFNADREAA